MPEALWPTQVEDEQHSAYQDEWKSQVVRDLRHLPIVRCSHQFEKRSSTIQASRQATEKEVPHQPPFPGRGNSNGRHHSVSSARRRHESSAARPSSMALPMLKSDDARTERDGNCGCRGSPYVSGSSTNR